MPILLPLPDGRLNRYSCTGTPLPSPSRPPAFNRIAYAAAHVVVDPLKGADPWGSGDAAVDWNATLAFRHHLWRHGFRIAEAMDTAQRGMGVSWTTARDLIRRTLAEAATVDGAGVACGAGTDQLDGGRSWSLADVRGAYEEQIDAIESAGGQVILMASRALVRAAKTAGDYEELYGALLRQSREPVILHWLGAMFDPALEGYWGTRDFETALETVIGIIKAHQDKVAGIKISLLDAEKEITLRRRLPDGVLMFTGDDFNYPDLIKGDDQGHSHALLGIFDPIAPAASAALARLADGDGVGFDALMAPTVPLSRRIFEAPTQYYKAGVVFLAWLNGFQDHFTMAGGMQSARGLLHYADVFRLADRAGLLADPDRATARMAQLCAMYGIT